MCFLSLFQICELVSNTTLACPSPKIDLASNMAKRTRRQTNEDDVLEAVLGFMMDGVSDLLDWSEDNDITFEYFEDPSYFPFGNATGVVGGTRILIKVLVSY